MRNNGAENLRSARERRKSPTFEKKTPTFSEKSPTFFGKSPTFFEKSPTFFLKRPTFFLKAPIFKGKITQTARFTPRRKGEKSRGQVAKQGLAALRSPLALGAFSNIIHKLPI